jgi:hypothetical protein
MTALGWAAKIDHGSADLLDALLHGGADPSATTVGDRTPRDWAEEFGNPWALDRLPAPSK